MVWMFEIAALALLFVAAWAFPHRTRRHGWRRGVRRVERSVGRGMRAVCVVGLVSFSLNAAVSWLVPPTPQVHDEFSYLLASDTFARGRITNPPHPYWRHFESLHIIHQPTYASKYPPANGLLLAVGQAITGEPIVGAWLGLAAACAAVCWMLQAWLPPRWAFWGGLLTALHPGMILSWGQMYWGGAAAMLGGAWVFGALRRLLRQPRATTALLLGVGLILLATSRPFEGVVAAAPVGILLLVWMIRCRSIGLSDKLLRVAAPLASVLAVGGVAMGYYNYRVTGDAFCLPYQVYERAYAATPLFIWQELREPPPIRHPFLSAFQHDWSPRLFLQQQTWDGFLRGVAGKLLQLASFHLRWLLVAPLLALPWLLNRRWVLFAVAVGGLEIAALLTVTFLNPHYPAPVEGLLIFLVVAGARGMYLASRGRGFGQAYATCLLLLCLGSLALEVRRHAQDQPQAALQRAELVRQLENAGGRHLVLVDFRPTVPTAFDWVFNEADIDNAAIVWARGMSPQENRELVEYFHDRHVWLLDANGAQPVLRKYRDPLASASTVAQTR